MIGACVYHKASMELLVAIGLWHNAMFVATTTDIACMTFPQDHLQHVVTAIVREIDFGCIG